MHSHQHHTCKDTVTCWITIVCTWSDLEGWFTKCINSTLPCHIQISLQYTSASSAFYHKMSLEHVAIPFSEMLFIAAVFFSVFRQCRGLTSLATLGMKPWSKGYEMEGKCAKMWKSYWRWGWISLYLCNQNKLKIMGSVNLIIAALLFTWSLLYMTLTPYMESTFSLIITLRKKNSYLVVISLIKHHMYARQQAHDSFRSQDVRI